MGFFFSYCGCTEIMFYCLFIFVLYLTFIAKKNFLNELFGYNVGVIFEKKKFYTVAFMFRFVVGLSKISQNTHGVLM